MIYSLRSFSRGSARVISGLVPSSVVSLFSGTAVHQAAVVRPRTVSRLALSCSSLSSVDRVLRLRSVLGARIRGLSFQFVNVLGSPPHLLDVFNREISVISAFLYRLGDSSVICNGAYGDVAKVWKDYPSSVEKHSIALFGSFTRRRFDPAFRLKRMQATYKSQSDTASAVFLASLKSRISDEAFLVDQLKMFIDRMELASLMGRRSELLRRLSIEMEHRTEEGWYFVFNTLTVDREHYRKVFPEKNHATSSAWTDYIRRCDRLFGITSFGSWSKAVSARKLGSEFHNYFAVVEEGGRTGRLHIHVLHIFKDLPPHFSDPNSGALQPYYREIAEMKSLWPFGNSTPKAVRFSGSDSFARKGWRWPVDQKKNYSPLTTKSFGAMVGYIGKYISKDFVDKSPGCIWRTRVSRNLGRPRLKKIVSELPLKSRLQYLKCPRFPLMLGLSRLPRLLLIRLLLKSLPPHFLRAIYDRALLLPRTNIMRRFQDLIRGITVFSRPNFGLIAIVNLRLEVVSNAFRPGSYQSLFSGATYATR